jgi:hypothetical protein
LTVTAECAGLLDHPTLPGELPDLQAVAATITDAARQAGLSVGQPVLYPPQPNSTPGAIHLDVSDQSGPGALFVQIARYLRPEWSTRPTTDRTFTCLRDNPLRGNTSVSRLPDGSTAAIGNCGSGTGSHDCSPVTVFSTNGIAVQVVGVLLASPTADGTVIRAGEPLTVPRMLELAETIAALG